MVTGHVCINWGLEKAWLDSCILFSMNWLTSIAIGVQLNEKHKTKPQIRVCVCQLENVINDPWVYVLMSYLEQNELIRGPVIMRT